MKSLGKKSIILVAALIIITLIAFLISGVTVDCNMKIKNKNLSYDIKVKGLKDTRDFTIDKDDNYYIAYENKIQKIDKNGKAINLIEKNIFNINSIAYHNNNLYFCSDNNLYSYNLDDNKTRLIMNTIPSVGDYNKCKLLINRNNLYVSIGAATNSGVVGEDNQWLNDEPIIHDITPKSVTLRGNQYSGTGTFVPFNTKNIKGELIEGTFPGNSSVVKYDLEQNKGNLFCWGIRNIKGMDFNSEGKVIGAVGGMENRGARPIKGDKDYIYEIKENAWYGWPDYSGGDPVTSPRFIGKNNTKVEFVLENHPTSNPMAPIYQHKSLSTIESLAVDKESILGSKDCIYFYDNDDNTIYSLEKSSVIKTEIEFNKSKNISLKFTGKSLAVLNGEQGIIFEVNNIKNKTPVNPLDKKAIYVVLAVLGVAIVGMAWKVVNR